MNLNFRDLHLLRYLANKLIKNNISCILILVFIRYTFLKLRQLQKIKVQIQSFSDRTFKNIVDKYIEKSICYIDYATCAFGVIECIKSSEPTWVNVCCLKSNKKYRLLLVPFENTENNKIYISETTLFNITNLLSNKEYTTYFISKYVAFNEIPIYFCKLTIYKLF